MTSDDADTKPKTEKEKKKNEKKPVKSQSTETDKVLSDDEGEYCSL